MDTTEPGRFPYRRSTGSVPYSQQPWIIGQYSGFAGPSESNRRFRELIAAGQRGLAVALDLPTQLGLDSDHPAARGEVGKVGVSLASLEDAENLFEGIDLRQLTQISTTANSIGPMTMALFCALAQERGVDPADFSVRLQNDVLKEYVARGTQVLEPEIGVRLATDAVEYGAKHLPSWVPMSISGYHMRDAGGTRGQELGFTLANTRAYITAASARGVSVESFARSITWFFSAAPEVFAEAAKFRAAREIWSTVLNREYGVPEDSDALRLRLIAYTLGGELSAYEPLNNAVRVTLCALAAVLGGTQVLFCSAIDEALGLPTDETALLSMRTQQILLQESGIAETVDPLGGGLLVEQLTDSLITEAFEWDRRVAGQGGSTAAISSGWMRSQIDQGAWETELRLRERPKVGEPTADDESRLTAVSDRTLFSVDPAYEEARRAHVREAKARRSSIQVGELLDELDRLVATDQNIVPACTRAFLAGITLGELMAVMIRRFGSVVPGLGAVTGAPQ
jgi:methylmalonyl-CoA mutase, N-terminal domain